MDFFREDKLLASALMMAARSTGGTLLESACEPIDLGGGDRGLDGGSSTMHRLA